MTKPQLVKLARQIIRSNSYLSLGTVNAKSGPWVSPVYYCFDNKSTFYYASLDKTVHSKNILSNSHVSFSVFDSAAPEGTGVGIQVKAKAEKVSDKEFEKAVTIYKSKFVTSDVLRNKDTYHLFKLTLQRVFVTDPSTKVDRRVEVEL